MGALTDETDCTLEQLREMVVNFDTSLVPAYHDDAAAGARPLRLAILEHSVHKIKDDDLIVSTLRPFSLVVGLYEGGELHDVHEPMQAEAQLLYENGLPVPTLPGKPAMTGEVEMMTHGRASFRLRLNVLSSQREAKRFRVRVHVAPAAAAGELTVISEPMRTITKLNRAPQGKRKLEDDEGDFHEERLQRQCVRLAPHEGGEPSELKPAAAQEQHCRALAISRAPPLPPSELDELRLLVHEQSEAIRELQTQHRDAQEVLGELRGVLVGLQGRAAELSGQAHQRE